MTHRRALSSIPRRALLKWTTAGALAGPGALDARTAHAKTSIVPFAYHAPQSELDDLRARLAKARWPERETVDDWSEGVPLAKLRSLVGYWQASYDWRRCETRLNAFPQFQTEIDGLPIHFLHVRSPYEKALPIIISHGWPGSVLEFLKVLGPLSDPPAHGGRPEDAFHVVVPSLPGFAFSGKPAERGWNAPRIAKAWSSLMTRLGYRHYFAQGGDWGAFVTTALAQQQPKGLLAIHLNFPQVVPNDIPTKLTPAEKHAVDALARFRQDGFGYFMEQATRPQTIGYPLADSAVGQAAWLYEIFQAVTDNNGDPEDALTRDEMLDEITLYWLTNSGASSARLYFEQRALGLRNNLGVVDLPVGCSIFPREVYRAPRSWAQQMYPGLFYWNEVEQGGHFAAFEQPTLFVRELRACFQAYRPP
jgi:pimeloyl-ACP methyl ester carboxylesterase